MRIYRLCFVKLCVRYSKFAMSVWKFWNQQKQQQQTKDKGEQYKSMEFNMDLVVEEGEVTEYSPEASPNLERTRIRHQMSVSRSGRYKQRQRKRSGILDNPDFVNEQEKSSRTTETQSSSGNPALRRKADGSDNKCVEVSRKNDYDCETPCICDLQERAERQVVAI